ncbi:MAG: amidohydrolase [Pirellulaceae bacterium]
MLFRTISLVLALLFTTTAYCAAPADLVFVNGAVYTVDPSRSWASALVVTGERIAYVGEDAVAQTYIGPETQLVDLNGRMLLPGFQDSHVHPGMVANPAYTVKLDGLMNTAAVLERIRQFALTQPGKGWIEGGGWDSAAFLPSGLPTRQMLDSVLPDRPAFLYDNSGHSGWANSAALEMARINSDTPDPPNGHIERDEAGQPTGVLHEDTAMALVIAEIPPTTPEQDAQSLKLALAEMTRLGITALQDAMATTGIAHSFKTLDERGELVQRTSLCLYFDSEGDDENQIKSFIAQRSLLAGNRLQASCVKLFLDGAYASHTVVLLEPYSDDPKQFGRGTLFIEPERLKRLVGRLDAEGFEVHVHAQGDGAVRAALEAFAAARVTNGFLDNRHTISHLVLINPMDFARFRELGVIANMTPLWSLGDAWESVFAPRLFGPERTRRIFPTRSLLGAGVMLVWGSDWDVTGVSPLDGLETATTHRYPGGIDLNGKEDRSWNPHERISLEQAIVAYTGAGAYLMHADKMRGSLEAGKLADLVVLSRNLFDTEALGIHKVKVDRTIVGGVTVFTRATD